MWDGLGLLWVAVWSALCGFALVRGRMVERIVGLAFLLNEVLDLATPLAQAVSTIRVSCIVGDLAVLVVLVCALIVSPRRWPIVALGMQGVSVLT